MISYVNTGVKQDTSQYISIPTDESIGGMLFDISGFESPFTEYPLLYNNFKGNNIQCIHNMDEAKMIGIEDNGFMNGLLYYHVSQFYQYVGASQELYIAIADCSESWDVIQDIHLNTNGKMFQIGVWTSQPVFERKTDGSIGFTSLISEMQKEADEICGVIGKSTYTTVPSNIILSGNTNYLSDGEINYKELPNALVLNCPKVSVLIVQNGTDDVHAMQDSNPLHAPVGSLGVAMACLSLCGAEESIASVKKCDMNKNEAFRSPELGIGKNRSPISDINRIWRNLISSNGYIIPTDYEGIEASYFFSSDRTLSEGDYRSIANNRVMHKCRRIACTALIPYINSHHIYDQATHNISVTSKTIITDSILTLMDSVMRNKNGMDQINGRLVEILDNKDLLKEDSISIKISIHPANYSDFIEEVVSH